MTNNPFNLVSIDSVPASWIEETRTIINRDGFALRADAHSGIEFKSLFSNVWLRMALPYDAAGFATAADRDQVLHQLQGQLV